MDDSPSRLRSLFSPPLLVALLALVVATGGTSYAVVKVTSADIKDHTIKTVDLAPATVKKLRGRTGPAGADFTEGIPSGRTVTGSVFYRIAVSQSDQHLEQSVAFPAQAPEGVVSADFGPDSTAVTTDDNASCTGSYEDPTAPAGHLCAYLSVPNSFAIGDLTSASMDELDPDHDRGFIVRLLATDPGTMTLNFTWAYTAP